MRKAFKKRIEDIPVEDAHGGSGSRRSLLSSDDPITSKIEGVTVGYLDAGGVFDWHAHPHHDEFFFILKGTGTIEYDDGLQLTYSAGDLIYSPANLRHRLVNTGEDKNEFIFIRVEE